MNDNHEQAPLLFINTGPKTYAATANAAKAVYSHVTAQYRTWRKANPRHLALDPSTRAILASKSRLSKGNYGSKVPLVVDGDENSVVGKSRHVAGTLLSESCKTPRSQRLLNGSTSVSIPRYNVQSLDPFSGNNWYSDREVRFLLHSYFDIVRPFATQLMKQWHWLDSLSQIQSTPALAYAVSSFMSIFLSGYQGGGRAVVLPPMAKDPKDLLWAVPPYIRLQTSCMVELKNLLQISDSTTLDICYQAILFLFKSSVLLGDGVSARMHLKALCELSVALRYKDSALKTELALVKVNLISALIHSKSLVITQSPSAPGKNSDEEAIDIERHSWHTDREWYNQQSSLQARMLAWRLEEPFEGVQEGSKALLFHIDPGSKDLSVEERNEVLLCYQVALYFFHHLHAINFDTSTPRIRACVTSVHKKLVRMDLRYMVTTCRFAIFNILMTAAMASRGRWERGRFVELIATHYPELRSMEDIYPLVVEFVNLADIVPVVLEEIWTDVLEHRSATVFSPPEL